MAKELSDIITRAAEVRDATLTAENTAERVGGYCATCWNIWQG